LFAAKLASPLKSSGLSDDPMHVVDAGFGFELEGEVD
jgi:hypothetical protein